MTWGPKNIAYHTAVYYPAGDEIIIYGGIDDSGIVALPRNELLVETSQLFRGQKKSKFAHIFFEFDHNGISSVYNHCS